MMNVIRKNGESEQEENNMINRVVLVGRLTKEPELRTTPSGAKVCQYTLAVNCGYFGKGCVFNEYEEIKDILDSVQEIRKCD